MEQLLVDAVIAITLVEGIALVTYACLTGRGLRPRDVIANLAAGLCLMGALRCVLHSTGWAWVALFLALAGAAHLVDLRARWRRSASVH